MSRASSPQLLPDAVFDRFRGRGTVSLPAWVVALAEGLPIQSIHDDAMRFDEVDAPAAGFTILHGEPPDAASLGTDALEAATVRAYDAIFRRLSPRPGGRRFPVRFW